MVGLLLSAGSLLLMGVFTYPDPNLVIILPLALVNSIGYACGMSTGQNQFLDTYNRIYAEHQNLKEIDANASSGPIKVVQNLANVIGLVIGGALLYFGFAIFFIIFGLIIAGVFVWTLKNREHIQI